MTYNQNDKRFNRYTVTTALPYANGALHIGHLAGVYIPSDIYVRYLRAIGEDVLFVGGSDEHGVPITIKAKKEGITPQEVVDRYHEIIKKSFQDLGISFDVYSRTTSDIHHKTASEFFQHLYDNNKLSEKSSMHYFDPEAGQFLADRYITGICPHCQYDKAFGDQCENCGTSLSANDLIEPKSTLSGAVPILKETKHWYLPLDEYENFMREWILEGHKEWKPNVYGQCKSWIEQGLEPRAVTRDLDWGVKVPIEGEEGKVLYVWFDAPIGYISNTIEHLPETWEDYWKREDTKLVHFIGKDNIVFHCIIFPAMLKAYGDYILPENVPANEFLNLEGDKISTSNNWAVWLHEYLEEMPNKQDVLRYVLCANAPETKDNDFTWKDFQTRNNSELVAILGNFVNRTIVLTHKYFDGAAPSRHSLTELDKEVLEEMKTYPEKIGLSIETYHFREALTQLMNLARLGNKYLTETEPWKTIKDDKERTETIINISLEICAKLAQLSSPFMPFTSDKLMTMLNIKPIPWKEIAESQLISPNQEINKPELLFELIENKTIEDQVEKLMSTKTLNEEATYSPNPQKPNIEFDDFTKLDIRVGTIIEAEKMPKTKKLLVLKVDTGLDQRTIVSGIAEHYKPEEIIGKQVSVLVNLAPKKLRGVESNGMILMAEDKDGRLSFISPIDNINNGGEIS